ncbi:kunitz-like toxin PcKuz3 [Ostrinia nubilalis]|uniref:PI-stichotoxin-She2a-like n=1 Tax=Ostrinia furnacalis TaxID=93504 RepID=UPI00103A08C5|nr:PI-stichotoxin-She2a-like [Ostrinia furnacalis]
MSKLFIVFLLIAVSLCRGQEKNCNDPMEPGLCYGNNDRFYFDTSSGACTQFVYGGCGGNGNNYETLEECQDKCEN